MSLIVTHLRGKKVALFFPTGSYYVGVLQGFHQKKFVIRGVFVVQLTVCATKGQLRLIINVRSIRKFTLLQNRQTQEPKGIYQKHSLFDNEAV